MSAFTGFGPGTEEFLSGLSENNNKAWFDAHRAEYDEHYIAPAKAFVVAAGEALSRIAPNVSAEPKVNGSIFRINRDIRFSKDKTPYKDHLDMWFWEGAEKKAAVSGFFLRVRSDGIDIGVGSHGFDKDRLAVYREAVVDPTSGAALLSTVETLERAGHEVKGEHYKRTPRGYEAEGDVERLLHFNALWTGADDSPESLATPEFVDYCVEQWAAALPLHRWLTDTLQ